MHQVETQDLEERDPAVAVAFELVVPVVAAGKPAVHDTHRARAAGFDLNRPFGRDRAGPPFALCSETLGRLPCGDLGNRVHAVARPEARHSGAANALIQLGRYEPGRDARSRGDGLPDVFGCAADLDLRLNAAAP